MKPKILLLPTYFPTIHSPIIGSQVLEQSEMMLEYFDIRSIYCLPGMGWKRFLFTLLFGQIKKNKGYQNCDHVLLSDKITAKGVFYFQSKRLPSFINQRLRNRAYAYVVKKHLQNGWKPKLIHSRTAEHAGLIAAHLSTTFKIPNLLTENCIFVLDKNITTKQIKDYRLSIETAFRVAVVSHYLKAFLLSQHYDCYPEIIGNMVDDDIFKLPSREENQKTFIIFSAGHTGFTKDWNTFFKVAKDLIINKNKNKIKIIIAVTNIYDEASKRYIPELAKKYGVSDFCEIKFEVPRIQIVELFQHSNIFVSTSVNETFGIATLESMFCGTPVVATRNGGIEDFINNDNGILCDIGDDQAISKAIFSIMEGKRVFDPKKVRESVIHKYGKDAFKERLKGLYEETINLANNKST
jgi:glycosyltransferase involved in cell wall biosynthesis